MNLSNFTVGFSRVKQEEENYNAGTTGHGARPRRNENYFPV